MKFSLVFLASLGLSFGFINSGKFISHRGELVRDYHSNGDVLFHVQAIIRESAYLPCNLEAPNDTVLLVAWYKGENNPIYSFDMRGIFANKPKHWKAENLMNRAHFRVAPEPATLTISNVSEKDEGEYFCRIDYSRSPTRNERATLTVVVPPQKISIIDEKGEIVSSRTSPYEEGGDMKLTCIVTGGKPEPTIKWWREGKLIESTETRSGFQNVRSSQLIIRGLQRSDQNSAFTCQASNNNISQPVSATTVIDIYFRPLSVEILSSNNPLSADRKYEMPCQTYGSRPAANITWLMDGRKLEPPRFNSSQKVQDTEDSNNNTTTSILIFTPTRQDNGRSLTCRASNDHVHKGIEEHTVKLNIFYVPILHLSLGSSLNPDDIEEGDDVYFECKVNANPWAYKVLWKHNTQVMQANSKAGVIMSNSNLALQAVTRSQAGNYSCVASNVEGDGDSNTVDLRIMYKPVCRQDQKHIYGVAKHEEARVLCEVDSYPPPDSFEWFFNNSAQIKEVPPTRFESKVHHFTSTLTYTPVLELDYGTVMCRANNLAGKQQDPCIFHIIAAGKPDPPYNCTMVNMTNESLEVECQEGFDGGQPQFFLLEVFDWKTGVLQANVSSKFPVFVVSGLDPGKILKMHVYAANGKGRSEVVPLEGFTLKVAEKQTVPSLDTKDRFDIATVLGVLIGCVFALLLFTVIILQYLKTRASRRDGSQAMRPGFLAVKEKVTLPLRTESDDLFEKDDKNPDVIPSNKDSDYQLGSAAQTPGLNNSVSTCNNVNDYEAISSPSPSPGIMPHQPTLLPNNTNATTEPLQVQETYVLNRDRSYPSQHAVNEVTYAELALARPNSLETVGMKNAANAKNNAVNLYGTLRHNYRDDPTIYAQIDHSRRPPPPLPQAKTSPMTSPASALFPLKQGLYHREVVTVRTPLMGCQQESCV